MDRDFVAQRREAQTTAPEGDYDTLMLDFLRAAAATGNSRAAALLDKYLPPDLPAA
jgi:hypothetical protein